MESGRIDRNFMDVGDIIRIIWGFCYRKFILVS